jgi:hypothetical protein
MNATAAVLRSPVGRSPSSQYSSTIRVRTRSLWSSIHLASTPASKRAGELPLDQIVRRYPLSEINTAFADAERGNVVKPVITFGE